MSGARSQRRAIVDPGQVVLRRAARVAVVMTAMAVLGEVVGDPDFATFATFGAFALLGFADPGGVLPTRVGLGVAFGAVGAVLVAVGTVASGHPVSSVAVMAVAAFALTFAEGYGGHTASSSRGLILGTVLALIVPGEVGDIGPRLAGWLVACGVGSIALVVLWPARERDQLRRDLADLARTVAPRLRSAQAVAAEELEPLRTRIAHLREDVDAAITRPAGPRARDQALLFLLDELGRTVTFLAQVIEARDRGTALQDVDLANLVAAAEVLDDAAAVLVGEATSVPTTELAHQRAAEMAAVDAVLEVRAGRGDARPVEGLDGGPDLARDGLVARFDVVFPVRMLTYLALSIGANALVAVGRPVPDTSFEYQATAPALHLGWRATLARFARTTREHLTPRSRWFRNAARAGLALGAAVAVADAIQLDHALWVVLGTLSVLRSSALDTGSSVLRCVSGTAIGFALAAVIMLTVGEGSDLLWLLLPPAIFCAAYLPATLSYLAGQAAFTVMGLVLFNLSDPVGWQLGLVRLNRVGIGVAVSVVAALLLWPRGVVYELARSVQLELAGAVNHLRAGIAAVLGSADRAAVDATGRVARAAKEVAEGELGNVIGSRGSGQLPLDTWARLVGQPHALLLGGDWLGAVAERQGPPASAVHPTPAVQNASTALAAAAAAVTDHVERGPLAPPPPGPPEGADVAPVAPAATALDVDVDGSVAAARRAVHALVADVDACAALTDRQVIALLWTLEWVGFVRHLDAQLAGPRAEVADALRRPWWG